MYYFAVKINSWADSALKAIKWVVFNRWRDSAQSARPLLSQRRISFIIAAFFHQTCNLSLAMPIYEYACSDCNHQLEKLQKMSDAPLVDCPACGKPTLKKRVSAAGFQLKGTGWYATDFKPKSVKSEN